MKHKTINNCHRCSSNEIKTELKIKSNKDYKKIRIYEILCENCKLRYNACTFFQPKFDSFFKDEYLSIADLKKLATEGWNNGNYNKLKSND